MTADRLIYVVDDHADVRESMQALLKSAGYEAKSYASAEAFLKDEVSEGICVIADIHMPGMDGVALQEEMSRRGSLLPVIMMTGYADVPLVVRAMKAGAVDFIEKPFADETLFRSLEHASQVNLQGKAKAVEAKMARRRIASLTRREKDVLDQLLAGRSNRLAGSELGISPRTVESHRMKIMEKLDARSFSDVVRIALLGTSTPSGAVSTAPALEAARDTADHTKPVVVARTRSGTLRRSSG